MDAVIDAGIDAGIEAGIDAGIDAGWTVKWTVGWTLGWTVRLTLVWTLGGRYPKILERDGHGRWTGWSRKLDAMVTESGQKRKIYCSF